MNLISGQNLTGPGGCPHNNFDVHGRARRTKNPRFAVIYFCFLAASTIFSYSPRSNHASASALAWLSSCICCTSPPRSGCSSLLSW